MRILLPLLLLICSACFAGPDHIEIDPLAPRLTHKGDQVRLHGKVMDRNGKVHGRAFFRSRDPKVASVDEFGLVTAVGSGITVIEAQSGSLHADMPIEVDMVERLAVGATHVEVSMADDPLRLPVSAVGRDGQPRPERAVSFTADDPSVVRIDPEGRVWGIAAGTTLVKARCDDKLAVIEVVVTDKRPPKKAPAEAQVATHH
jgi:hypothetical protein